MVLVAHWPIDDGILNEPTVTRDIACNLSGTHHGIPIGLSTNYDHRYSNYRAGGVGGNHIHKGQNTYNGSIQSIFNPTDFYWLGEITISGWIGVGSYGWTGGDRSIFSYTGIDETSPENDIFDFRTNLNGLELRWERLAGIDIIVSSISSIFDTQGRYFVAAERYELTAVPGKYGVRFYVDGNMIDDNNNGGTGYDPPTDGINSIPRIACTQTWNGGYRSYYYDSIRFYNTAVGPSQIASDYYTDLSDGGGHGQKLFNDWENLSTIVEGQGSPYTLIPSGPHSSRTNAGFSN